PLRDRFGFTANLDFYDEAELAQVLSRAAGLMKLDLGEDALALIASRSRGTPRIANRLLRRVRDFALVHSKGLVSVESVTDALELYEVDELGLDRLDRSVLEALIVKFEGKPVGLNTLSVALGEETDTIESVVEPFLLRIGLLVRTTRGRQATSAGYRHLGIALPDGAQGLFD
ncbi:MAG: Holliday junction branch migration DNA helicase RuvB, partial [Rhodoluna sp.]|nr:Holliday junction branch migration DNA helicase RuvB [Rhodoluna sp.]